MKTVYPVGTTLYKPAESCGGYHLVPGAGVVKLVDMNGGVAHRWRVDPEGAKGFIHRTRLLPNGRLMALFGGRQRRGHVAEFDWEGQETWAYEPEHTAHHDFWPTARGTVFLICAMPLPPDALARIHDPERRRCGVIGDELIEVDRARQVLWRWRQHEHLDVNRCNPIPANRNWLGGPDNNTIADWTHTNTIQELPENRWHDAGDRRFKPGHVLQSLRQLDTINIIDRDSGEVVWSYSGDYNGGLSGPHEPHMIEKGLPGDGHILVFDNGASPCRDLAHCGCSYVLEIDPRESRLVWVYDDGHRFFSRFTANCQRLPNGNTLILESLCRRLFEVTPAKALVWEHVLTDPAQRVYRYPYGYCEAFHALPPPRERAVTPPVELRIEPDPEP